MVRGTMGRIGHVVTFILFASLSQIVLQQTKHNPGETGATKRLSWPEEALA